MTDECPICLEPLTAASCALECRHRFHSACILQSVLHDPRCPVCRGTLGLTVPPAPPPRHVAIAVSVEDIDSVVTDRWNTVRRQQINYDARRRRLVRNNPVLRRAHDRAKEMRRHLRDLETALDHEWSVASRELWKSDRFLQKKQERARTMRRLRDFERQIERAATDAFGERPEIDLDSNEPVVNVIALANQRRLARHEVDEEEESS